MKKGEPSITAFESSEEAARGRKNWQYSFYIYTCMEVAIIAVQYFITWHKCPECTLPPLFYILNWLMHILFTGILWYCLYHAGTVSAWKKVMVNILLFTAHYFLWIGALYLVFHSGQKWLTGEKGTVYSFRALVYASWPDIGKYVVKLSAFYVLKFYFDYRQAERQRIKLALINKDMQLNLLKQQLSPHFYFNTLNNLYGLARSNSEKLSGALHQLSNIMRYVIKDCNQPEVLLSQEMTFLESYIALEKLRYEHNTVIEVKVEGDIREQTIVPLLLIQFVENAFKHGMKEKSDRNWMKVNAVIKKNELVFKVDNSYYEPGSSEGIGIESVKNMLNLRYEGRCQLNIMHENNRFSVTLKLGLS